MISDKQFAQQMSRNDLLSFAAYTDKFFDIIDIHEQMAKALQDIESWKINRLILELPPRSGKSRITSEFVAWFFGRNPTKDIILTWHSSSLLEWFSRNIRDRIDSAEYSEIFNTKIKDWASGVKSWKTDQWGEFSIYWVGWWITWKWGDILIIDDPYSGREDAESDTIQKKTWDWYKSTLLSRRHNDNSAIIVIMQRWKEDDLVWRLLEEDHNKNWTRISIPAIDDKWQSFWKEKFSIKYLEEMRKEIGEYFFMSQYQQDPVNEWSGAFKKDYFSYSTTPTDEQLKTFDIVSFLDPAISKKQEADSSAIVTVGIDPKSNLIHILDIKKMKEEPDVIIDEVFRTVSDFMYKWNSYMFWVEIVAYQKMLALEIQKQMRTRNKFFVLEEVRPQGEKEARIRSMLQPRYSNMSVIHDKWIMNTNELESELLKFPNWKHDDLIDALASAVSLLEWVNLSQTWDNFVSFDYSDQL